MKPFTKRWSQMITAAAVISMAAAATPPMAAVGVREGIVVDGVPIIRTTQNEIHVVARPGTPTRRAGSLPRNASPMIDDGRVAWSVTTGRRAARNVRLFQIGLRGAEVSEMIMEPDEGLDRIDVTGIAGADPLFVFLGPSYRYRRTTGTLEAGHLDDHPGLEILQTLNLGEETWYLAADGTADSDEDRVLWLLYSRAGGPPWIKVPAGTFDASASISMSDGDLFLVHRTGPILRFGLRTLRLEEDLSPMMRPGSIEFFSADATDYWLVISPSEDGEDRDLWKIDRWSLDGGIFHTGAVPAGFVPVADDGSRIWFGATGGNTRPLVAAAKSDTTAQAYAITGKHARRWRALGRGVRDTVLVVGVGAAAVAVAVVGTITAPIWVPIVVANS